MPEYYPLNSSIVAASVTTAPTSQEEPRRSRHRSGSTNQLLNTEQPGAPCTAEVPRDERSAVARGQFPQCHELRLVGHADTLAITGPKSQGTGSVPGVVNAFCVAAGISLVRFRAQSASVAAPN